MYSWPKCTGDDCTTIFRRQFDQQDATEALALAHELGDRPYEARILNVLGLLETGLDPRASLPTFERSRELAQAVGDDWCVSEATQNAGWALVMAGEHDAARSELEASFEIARRHGLRELVAWHWFMLGHAVYPTGDRDTARVGENVGNHVNATLRKHFIAFGVHRPVGAFDHEFHF